MRCLHAVSGPGSRAVPAAADRGRARGSAAAPGGPRTCAGSSLSVPPASLPPATRRQEWAPAGQKEPLPSRDSHLGQDTCTETDSRQARRVGNPLDRGPPPDPLYPKTLRPPRGPGLPSVSWRKEAGPGKGLEALRTCSACCTPGCRLALGSACGVAFAF